MDVVSRRRLWSWSDLSYRILLVPEAPFDDPDRPRPRIQWTRSGSKPPSRSGGERPRPQYEDLLLEGLGQLPRAILLLGVRGRAGDAAPEATEVSLMVVNEGS
jgi:hypothetical protein